LDVNPLVKQHCREFTPLVKQQTAMPAKKVEFCAMPWLSGAFSARNRLLQVENTNSRQNISPSERK
jgi:hypothetical protein